MPHVGVLPRRKGGGKTEDIIALTCLYADLDRSPAEAQAALRAAPYPPSLVVHSGRGVHAYWLLDRAYLPAEVGLLWRAVQRELVSQLCADGSGIDLPRLLRVPGTWNTKRGCLVKLVECYPERRYTLAAFRDALGVPDRVGDVAARAALPGGPRRSRSASGPTPSVLEPPAALRALLTHVAVGWRWRPESGAVVLERCPACEADAESRGGAERWKSWVNGYGMLQCWRGRCPAGAERAPGGLVHQEWIELAVALGWGRGGPVPAAVYRAVDAGGAT